MSKASAAKGSRSRYARKGVLIEEGRTWLADGKEVRRYTCGWRRLVVSVIGRRVAIARECGVVCSGITLSFFMVMLATRTAFWPPLAWYQAVALPNPAGCPAPLQ